MREKRGWRLVQHKFRFVKEEHFTGASPYARAHRERRWEGRRCAVAVIPTEARAYSDLSSGRSLRLNGVLRFQSMETPGVHRGQNLTEC